MKLATWNVNSLKVRLPRVLEFLAKHSPDVLCLQETKTEAAAFPHLELAEAGYSAVEHSAGRWAGVAILAPQGVPLDQVTPGLPGEPDASEARYLEATVSGVRVASTYVPNGRELGTPHFAAKLAFLDALAARAGEIDVLMGDLNVTRAEGDVYDPQAFEGSTHVTAEERERLERVIGAGLLDAYRELHPEDVGFTWWDYRQGHFHRKMGLRID
ncbi:MAG: exodeoxyribonuclease III, partial [Thermoleophilaceae bacterium]